MLRIPNDLPGDAYATTCYRNLNCLLLILNNLSPWSRVDGGAAFALNSSVFDGSYDVCLIGFAELELDFVTTLVDLDPAVEEGVLFGHR